MTSLGAEEEISCNVHAYPKPSVTWMKVGFVVLIFLRYFHFSFINNSDGVLSRQKLF